MPAKEVQEKAKAALVSPRTLKRAKKRLGVTSRRTVVDSGKSDDTVIHWVWELPKAAGPLMPYRDRATKEGVRNFIENVEKVTQLTPETTEAQDSLSEFTDRPWEHYEECDPTPEPVMDVPSSRPWDD